MNIQLDERGEGMDCSISSKHIHALTIPYNADCICPIDWARRTIFAFREQLCGKDLFCREGMAEAYKLIEDISEGKGAIEDLALLKEIFNGIRQMANCECAKLIAANVCAALNNNMEVWEAHIRRKRCVALQCSKLLTYYIDAAKCNGCGICARECQPNAIKGEEGMYYVVSQDDCTQCGKCSDACPNDAVCKAAAGTILPKLPDKPGPVGSFKSGLGGLRRGLRRT